jgi:hypothetical protein
MVGLLAAAVVLRASVGRDDIWVFFAGLGLLSISSVFLLHSLATENVLLGASHPSFSTSPPTSLAAGALFFSLCAIPYNYRFEPAGSSSRGDRRGLAGRIRSVRRHPFRRSSHGPRRRGGNR